MLCVLQCAGEWILAGSAARFVCLGGSHQPGQQCSLWRDCSALPGTFHAQGIVLRASCTGHRAQSIILSPVLIGPRFQH